MRLELIHPALVHFPIALLLVGSALRLAAVWKKNLLKTSWLILFIGLCFEVVTIIFGEIAEDIVRAHLKNPEILNYHMYGAYSTALLFIFAFAFDIKKRRVLATIFYSLSVIALLITGALGGSLVYEQGAAVQISLYN